jgi:hypothetical protein
MPSQKARLTGTTYSHRLMHEPEEESAHVLVVADNTEGLARACHCETKADRTTVILEK